MSRVLVILLLTAALARADSGPVTITDSQIVLRDPIYFETGKPVIKKESFAELDALAATLAQAKQLTLIEIGSHTDERGSSEYNLEISQQRADAIRDYLVGKGIDGQRLRAKGYGESKPLDKHHNAAAWAKNRRTELVILQRTS